MRAAGLLAALLAVPALYMSGCEGTSSGVDNPGVAELTVDFRDGNGAPLSVSGDLDVFGKDQNPALYPEPLATIKVLNSSTTNLSGEDFDRIRSGNAGDPPSKRAATVRPPPKPPADGPLAFNVVFRGDAGLGSLAFGLSYDPKRRAFIRSGAALAGLEMRPQPVIRYAARLAREAVHGDVGRVFIPGSPYLAALADSDFVLEDLPEGVFDLRLLAGDGSIFAVKESLDTRVSKTFTAAPVPLGHIDSSDTMAKPVAFTVVAAGPPDVFATIPAMFDARLVGVEPHLDKRASYLWRQINTIAPDTAIIKNAAAKGAEITFPASGVYTLEVTVTIGVSTMRDTLIRNVHATPVPAGPRINIPPPGDSLVAGMQYRLSWEMPAAGSATVEVTRTAGTELWETVAADVPSVQGISEYDWMVPDSLAPARNCLLRVRLKVGVTPDSLVAVSGKPFAIVPRPAIVKPPDPLLEKPVDSLPKP